MLQNCSSHSKEKLSCLIFMQPSVPFFLSSSSFFIMVYWKRVHFLVKDSSIVFVILFCLLWQITMTACCEYMCCRGLFFFYIRTRIDDIMESWKLAVKYPKYVTDLLFYDFDECIMIVIRVFHSFIFYHVFTHGLYLIFSLFRPSLCCLAFVE